MKVLFVGNSLTFFREQGSGADCLLQDLPGLLRRMSGGGLEAEGAARSGAGFKEHREEGRLREGLARGPWNAVVLQDSSRGPLADPSGMREQGLLLGREALEAGAETLLFETWAPRGEPGPERVAAAYAELGGLLPARVVPVGTAWRRAEAGGPGLELYSPDGLHAAPLGAYLTACVFYGALLRENPASRADRGPAEDLEGLAEISAGYEKFWGRGDLRISMEDLAFLQEAAWESLASAGRAAQ